MTQTIAHTDGHEPPPIPPKPHHDRHRRLAVPGEHLHEIGKQQLKILATVGSGSAAAG
jgi:hypothetical protein